jgi:hypothetical protein
MKGTVPFQEISYGKLPSWLVFIYLFDIMDSNEEQQISEMEAMKSVYPDTFMGTISLLHGLIMWQRYLLLMN